ncbi:MAG: hypothetical protein ACEQSU_14860 [Microgenomates group bacterium]
MTTYVTIPTGDIDQDSPITQPLLTALRDNVVAAFQGDATAVSAGVTLLDAALDTGGATSAGITWVGNRMAGNPTGSVGTYAMLAHTSVVGVTATTVAAATNVAGSSLAYASAAPGVSYGSAPSGTWKCMGRCEFAQTSVIPLQDARRVTLFMRIS